MQLAIVNESTVVPNASAMIAAVVHQLHYDLAPAWGFVAPHVRRFDKAVDVPADWFLISILDDADQADALGYHDEVNGRPYGRVFAKTVLDNGGTIDQGANSVSVTLSHEACELLVDPNVELWADDGANEEVCVEACDPCQGSSYTIRYRSREIAVSDFVFPSYFDPQGRAPFDQMQVVKGPHSIAKGGYLIVRSAGQIGQRTNFRFGAVEPAKWLAPVKLHPAARTARRLRA